MAADASADAFSSREFLRQQALVANADRYWVEKVPHRLLELRHILDLAGLEHSLPEWQAMWQGTMLAHDPSALFFSTNESYSVTHTLFYLSDFGRTPIKCIPAVAMRNVSRLVQNLLGLYLRRRDFDLAGELLLCERCLRTQPSFMFGLGWHLLKNEQANDGSLLGPGFQKKEGEAVPSAEEMFRWRYHTTLVAAMAGSVCSDDWEQNISPKTESAKVQVRKKPVCFSDSVELAQEWMRKMVDTKILPAQTGTKYLLQCLFGLWMCRMMGAPADEAGDLRITDGVLEFPALASGEFDPFEFDPKLLLFCMVALRAQGWKHLLVLDKFATTLADAFSQFQKHDCAYAGERLLLHRLGHKVVLPIVTEQQRPQISESPIDTLRLDLAGVTALCHDIENATLYGTIAPQLQPIDCESLSIWGPLLFETLNSDELIIGSTILRSMLYMGFESAPEALQAIDFLLLQQEVDGKFGQFPEKASTVTESPPDLDAELDFSLPVTLRCLWTLGEFLLPDFRLFSAGAS